jgi:hypothetical protein
MLVASQGDGHVVVTQQAHAWLSGQLARAWGGERFGPVVPREEVCLAAEQHDLGMASWDREPELDPGTGLPRTFMAMDLATHLRLWTEGPELLLGQSRYAGLLASMHGTALYARRDLESMEPDAREMVIAFLRRRAEFEQRVRGTLDAGEPEIARNQRLVWTWDGMSLALILGWAPWVAEAVPLARGGEVDVRVVRADAGGGPHAVSPWPFVPERLTVRTQGRLLAAPCSDAAELGRALAAAPWIDLDYELVPD